ncbi:MAG: hypothetical protein ACRDQY_11940, partial [Pseudonocardiaceae bacterium]
MRLAQLTALATQSPRRISEHPLKAQPPPSRRGTVPLPPGVADVSGRCRRLEVTVATSVAGAASKTCGMVERISSPAGAKWAERTQILLGDFAVSQLLKV